jgi:phytoene synthase
MNAAQLCSQLTRKSRSNFYYAFLFLPRPRREALYAVYAFCRTVDDAVDLGTERAAQQRELARWRAELARCYEGGRAETPIGRRLTEAVRAYAIPRSALEAILEGVEMDLDHHAYESFDALYPYCYRVASAVGLCCIEIFGYTDPRAQEYAVNLGVALQLTNIMRDVGGDALAGRVYLPQDELARFSVTPDDLRAGRYSDAFVALMEYQATRACGFYAAARRAFPTRDARTLAAAEIMGRIYRALLDELVARRFRVFGERVTVPTHRKLAIAFRTWAGARLTRAA